MNCTRISAAALCALLSACVEAPMKTSSPAAPAKTTPSATPPGPAAPPVSTPVAADPAPPANVAPTPGAVAPPPKIAQQSSAKPAVQPPAAPRAAAAPAATPAKKNAQVAASAPAPAAASGATVAGSLTLVAGNAQRVDAAEVADAVVYFVPDAVTRHPKPGQFQIYTRDKQFDPTSTVVPLGSTINFPNKDEVLHNVFSASPGAEFDLGLFGEGKSAAYTFVRPGIVTVHCNVHPLMQVSVLVVDTPYFIHPSSSGEFQLSGLPAGSGKLVVWHPRAGLQTFPLPSSATSGLALQITLNKPRVAPHLNKERKPYQTAQSK